MAKKVTVLMTDKDIELVGKYIWDHLGYDHDTPEDLIRILINYAVGEVRKESKE